jgi:hypothetical protein
MLCGQAAEANEEEEMTEDEELLNALGWLAAVVVAGLILALAAGKLCE